MGVLAMQYLHTCKGEQAYRTGSEQTVATTYDDAGRWTGDYKAAALRYGRHRV